MINNEDEFFSLIKEFLLISENQKINPVLDLVQFEKNSINEFHTKINQIYSILLRDIKSNFQINDSIKFLQIINDLLIQYYCENHYYFNYKSKINIINKNIRDYNPNFTNDEDKYLLVNLKGMFLVSKCLDNKKQRFIKTFLLNYANLTIENINHQLNLNKSLFHSFIDIVNILFTAIGFIENLIVKNQFEMHKIVSNYYLANISVIKSKFYTINSPNNNQINDWEEVYNFNYKKDVKIVELPPINSQLLDAEQEIQFRKIFSLSKENTLSNINGLLLHAENLKALKYIKDSYKEKIDCVYIDPPYNTGSGGFQYHDDYQDNHWYWFMENRISILYELLNEDGIIFISIDDNQIVSLRLILDKIFDRFIGMYVWHKKTQPSFLNKELISVTEYILVYKKGTKPLKLKGGLTDPNKHTELLNISNEVTERLLPKNNTKIFHNGNLFTGTLNAGTYGNNKLEVELKNTIIVNKGIPEMSVPLVGRFRWTQAKIDSVEEEKREIVIKSLKTLRPTVSGSGKSKIRPPITLLSKKINEIPTNTDGNFEMKNLFTIPPFYYPKPVDLIKFLIDSVTFNKKDALILDCFAGSGTTGHAVINLNRSDGGKRKFILIEEAEYFDTILVPRIKKCLYSSIWEKGRPLTKDNFDSIIQIIQM